MGDGWGSKSARFDPVQKVLPKGTKWYNDSSVAPLPSQWDTCPKPTQEIQMTTINITTAYASFLKTGADFKSAVAAALGDNQFLPDATVDALAAVHANAYKCEPRQTDGGRWTFYADDKRSEAATKAWARWVGCFHKASKSTRGGATSKQKVSEAAKLAALYEKLTAAQRKEFRRLTGIE
jgi:hypothetical protein